MKETVPKNNNTVFHIARIEMSALAEFVIQCCVSTIYCLLCERHGFYPSLATRET